MLLLYAENNGYSWIIQVPNNCHMFFRLSHLFFYVPTYTYVQVMDAHPQMSGFFVDCLWRNWIYFSYMISEYTSYLYVYIYFLNSYMIAHDHVDIKYVHYSLDFYHANANHAIGSFVKLIRDLERPQISFSCALIVGCRTTQIYEGKEVCLSSL